MRRLAVDCGVMKGGEIHTIHVFLWGLRVEGAAVGHRAASNGIAWSRGVVCYRHDVDRVSFSFFLCSSPFSVE